VLDPSVIGFGTIDDIDQVAGKRGDRQSSPGQQEVTAVFMGPSRGGDGGAGQLHLRDVLELPRERGRRPAPAGRGAVPGRRAADARGLHRHPLAALGKNHAIPVGDHELFAAQEIKKAVAASFEGIRPHEEGLLKVWDRVRARSASWIRSPRSAPT
jgi:hypothetical protein